MYYFKNRTGIIATTMVALHDIQKLCNVPFKIFNELKNWYYIVILII